MADKILVADDDPDNRAIMAAALSRAGYAVTVARDGFEAVEAAHRDTPALILLDMAMPHLSGWETVKALKSHPTLKQIPIFAFTAHALEGDEDKTREAGCDGYISKPCIPQDAVEKIGRWLAARRQSPGTLHAAG